MKDYFVEYKKDNRILWCVMEADRREDIEYTVNLYGCEVVTISEMKD